MKLHLGCDSVIIPGFVNVDLVALPGVDLICDARDLQVEGECADMIYTSHLLDHFGRVEWLDVLRHWYSKLKLGGTIRISVGDFRAICEHYLETNSLEGLFGLVVGGQRDAHDWHGMIFDFEGLAGALEEVGFVNVRRYDWRDVEPGCLGMDDYSQAHLPHMDKEHGRLMSLNVEADRPR